MEDKDEKNNQNEDVEDKDKPKARARALSQSSDKEEDPGVSGKRQCKQVPSFTQHDGFTFPGIPASPPKFVSMEHISHAADAFSNMALAHEISINKEFLLQKREGGLEKQVKEIVHRAFWDSFQSSLNEDPPNYSHALTLLEEIKEIIMDLLLPHQVRLREQINAVLDLELIKQQVENGTLDFHYYSQFLLSLMSRMCAPVRDDAVRELTEITDVVELYKGIMKVLDLMKLDMANFTIQQMRPYIQQHSVEYEKKKFQEFQAALKRLSPPMDELEMTRIWLRKTYETTLRQQLEKSSSSKGSNDIPNSTILTKAYLDIFYWDKALNFPETLQMDHERFDSLTEKYFVVIIAASILLVTYSIVGEAIHGISSLKAELKDKVILLLAGASTCQADELSVKLQSISLQVVQDVNQCLEQHGYSALDDAKMTQLKAQICGVQSEEHSVRALIKTRVLEFLEQLLTASNPGSVKYPPGLSAFHKELTDLGGPLLQLTHHNLAVFNEYYENIISELKRSLPQRPGTSGASA